MHIVIRVNMIFNRVVFIVLLFISLIVFSVTVKYSEAEYASASDEPDTSLQLVTPLPDYLQNYLSFIEHNLDSTNTVGAALTIVQSDKVLVLKGYGLRKAGGSEVVNEHTSFRLASVSKGFAGVLACKLEEDSILKLNDRIVDYLPEFKLKNPSSTDGLTLLHTLSHTSGLVPHAYDNLIEDKMDLADIMKRFDKVDIAAVPGQIYGYQNILFSLIDTILQVRTGYNYAYHLQNRIFTPLGMEDASVSFEGFLLKGNFAYPHVRSGSQYIPIRHNKGYYELIPAAGVNASISDLSKWLIGLLGYNEDIISRESCSIIAMPRIKTPLKRQYTRRWDKLDDKSYSLGWPIYEYKGRDIVYHGGYVMGYRAEIAFCPEEDIGISFLQNSPNRLASQSIPTFFNYYFNMKDRADSVKLQNYVNTIESLTPEQIWRRSLPSYP